MSEGYIIGGGGSDLNFKVIAVASELLLPATAKENTIAVITTAAITSYVFSSTAPTSPAEGMVWFATSTASTVGFNAIKKNSLWVYPTGCQQYVSGAWVSKTAKTYRDGAWQDWSTYLYLYNHGIINTDVTGEFTTAGYTGDWTLIAPTFEANRIALFGKTNGTVFSGTANAVDLTPYTQLKIDADVVSTYESYAAFTFNVSQTKNISSNVLASVGSNTLGEQTLALDVNSINQSVYLSFVVGGIAQYQSYIYALYLE